MDAAAQANQFLEKFIKPVVALVVILVVGGIAYHFHNKSNEKKNAKIANEFFVLKKELQDKQGELVKADQPKSQEKNKETKPTEPRPEELKAAVEPTVNKLIDFIKANQGTVSALEGSLIVSEVVTEYKDESKAIEALTLGSKNADKENFLYGVAQDLLGDLLQKNDKCNEAAQIWESLLNNKDHGYLADSLRLKAGVCYEQVGMLDKAELLYQKVVDVSPNSTSGQTAKKFLLHLKFKKSQKTEDASSQNNG